STVRAANLPLWPGKEIPQGGSGATVTAIMIALEAVMPRARTEPGSARIVVVLSVPGERFDGPVEVVAGRAADRALSSGPSVERMVYRHVASAGSPHRTAPSWSR